MKTCLRILVAFWFNATLPLRKADTEVDAEVWGVRGNSGDDYNTLQIGHATSRDGVHWTEDPANPVLPRRAANEWVHDGTWDPFVIYKDGLFKMWHGGGLSWQVQNPAVMLCHDAYIVNLPEDLHLMYYGPDGYFDQTGCDVRLALFKSILDNLAKTK